MRLANRLSAKHPPPNGKQVSAFFYFYDFFTHVACVCTLLNMRVCVYECMCVHVCVWFGLDLEFRFSDDFVYVFDFVLRDEKCQRHVLNRLYYMYV